MTHNQIQAIPHPPTACCLATVVPGLCPAPFPLRTLSLSCDPALAGRAVVTYTLRDALDGLVSPILLIDILSPGAMASAGVAAGRQAEDALPLPSEPPLSESKAQPPSQPPPVAASQSQQSPAPRPQSPAGVKEEENHSFLPLVHNVIKW